MTTLPGIAAFALYFLYDINDYAWKRKFPRSFFALATLLLALATTLDLRTAVLAGAISGIADLLWLLCAAICFGLLMYCLFFALPFSATYATVGTPRKVCRTGAYAFCRHPGILCLFGMYLFLSLAALPEKLWVNGIVFSLCDLAYAWFQDCISFPKTFSDYADYRKNVPFLIPTRKSILATFTKEDIA